jgi:hypothetical protein
MAIVACFVFQREISRSVFWDFFDSIRQTRKSSRYFIKSKVQCGPGSGAPGKRTPNRWMRLGTLLMSMSSA